MNRRTWLKTAVSASAACALPLPAFSLQSSPDVHGCHIETSVVRLKLRHTWTTTMSSSDYRDTLHLRLTSDGVTGLGEGAPIVRYHEDALGAQKAIASILPMLNSADPWFSDKIMLEVF